MQATNLSLRERGWLALRALVGTLDVRPGSVGETMLRGIFPGAVGQVPTRGTREFLMAYSTMPWLRAVTHKVSFAVAAVQWKLYYQRGPKDERAQMNKALASTPPLKRIKMLRQLKQAKELNEVTSHVFLDALDRPNPLMTGLAHRKLSQVYIDLVGECYWMKDRNRAGVPGGFWVIPPNWFLSTPTPSNRKFRYSWRSWQGEIDDTEVLWMTDPNPEQPYGRGSGTASALSDELETDEMIAKHLRQFFFNSARPDIIITAGGGAPPTREEMQRLEQEWLNRLRGFWRAWKPFFVNRELIIHELEQNFRALQLVQLREFERDLIVQVFGVPPEIVGIITNSNRATIDAADYLFAQWVLIPRLEMWRTHLQEFLIPEYDERLILHYESPVQEDREFALKVGQVTPEALSHDEWRLLAGLEPEADGLGEKIHYVRSTVSPMTLDEMNAPPPPPPVPMAALPPASGGGANPEGANGAPATGTTAEPLLTPGKHVRRRWRW